MPKLS
ncbi:uncharacterized protein FTOL_13897 [Fusarium torulosum]